jgi:hypothetical protein
MRLTSLVGQGSPASMTNEIVIFVLGLATIADISYRLGQLNPNYALET